MRLSSLVRLFEQGASDLGINGRQVGYPESDQAQELTHLDILSFLDAY